ncbi:MAG: asparagine--tRNA ligase [Candidatus Kerfeldbacteria bacterium]|nr:asparagine--tRNA ligase [Candidatus Kerfeldbacteria bacterium]
MKPIHLSQLKSHEGEQVTIRGWVFNFRSSGKIYFLQIRDGFGRIQGVVSRETVDEQSWVACEQLTLESSVEVSGTVRADTRSPFGYELHVSSVVLVHRAEEYPIGKKEHGVDFLLDHRHLWLRAERQRAIMRVRDEIIWSMREFFRQEQYTLTDTPILTPTACEGTTTLFATDYFEEKAYLSQSGQLYLEALAMALGKVYDFGPTFRAEKSKTRRHLMEFWMLDAEAAFVQHEENLQIQERLVTHIVQSVLANRAAELQILERDVAALQKVQGSFVRLRYDDAIVALQKLGSDIKHGDDFGADDETMLMKQYDKPVFVTHYPVAIKAFYMQPDPENQKFALCADLLAPEGYGEVIGGSERIWDYELLRSRLKEHKLSESDFGWYLDLRKYGSVPHSGFGIGLERTVAWLCGLDHVRETIPFPRLLNRLRP